MAINTHVSTDQSAALSRNRLLFVYNADSGFLNMLKDWTHKIECEKNGILLFRIYLLIQYFYIVTSSASNIPA
ncbi:unnamed protein product [Rotaria magnacalcarata]